MLLDDGGVSKVEGMAVDEFVRVRLCSRSCPYCAWYGGCLLGCMPGSGFRAIMVDMLASGVVCFEVCVAGEQCTRAGLVL